MKIFGIACSIFLVFVAGLWTGERITMAATNRVFEEKWAGQERQYEQQLRAVIRLAICESAMQPLAIGDVGKSHGILQFQYRTFAEFARRANRPELNWRNPEDQFVLALWALQNDLGHHWTCYDTI